MNRFTVILTATLIALSLNTLVSCKSRMQSDLYLVNGVLDKDKFPAVIQSVVKRQIVTSVGQGESRATCTASIVSDRVVLTAAHCLVDRPEQSRTGFESSEFQQGQGPLLNTNSQEVLANTASVNINGTDLDGGRPYIHDEYLTNNGPDVGVIVFEAGVLKRAFDNKDITKDGQKVNFEQIIMSIAGQKNTNNTNGLSLSDDSYANYNYTNENQVQPGQSNSSDLGVGSKVTIVGFGKTDQFDENSGGEKRYGTNQLTKVGKTLDFNGQTQSTTADGTNVFNSQGDSGGPMMAADGRFAGLIVGVSSTQNTVSAGETVGEGHYTNLTEQSVASFISKHLEGFSGGNQGYIPSESDFRNSELSRGSQATPNSKAQFGNSNSNKGSMSNQNRMNGQSSNGQNGSCVCTR